jgi:hypothetical protein
MKRPFLVALLLASPLSADEVFLRGGGHVKGIIVERSDAKVVLDVGAGRVGIPTSHIERIVEGRTALTAYLEKAGRLAADDVSGWLALAYWAQAQDLQTQAREAFERVVALDPENTGAQQALGRMLVAGAWLGADEAYRARGYVPFEGSWITPAERESILGQRRDETRAEGARAEADARVREAEARARVAEAEAQRAEAEAAVSDGGIPLGWGAYGVPFGVPVAFPGRHDRGSHGRGPCRSCSPQTPQPQPTPAPSPPPRH